MNVTVCIQYKPQRLSQHPAPPIHCEGGNYSDGRPSSILPRHGTRDTRQGVFKFVLVPPRALRITVLKPRTVPALRIWHSVAPTC
jgi:hypothetical protein